MFCNLDLFKNPSQLAGQFRVGFLDRTLKCNDKKNSSIESFQASSNATKSLNGGLCRGRSVVVGEGCVDLIFAIDCSNSISEHNFNLSLAFAAQVVAQFNISADQARVALLTYDHRIHLNFNLGDKKTKNQTVEAIKSAGYCDGAMATGPVLKFMRTEILSKSRLNCKRVIFLLTGGKNNWSGDPIDEAEQIKNITDTEIYTISYGDSDLHWNVLSRLASKKEYFFAVREPVILNELIKKSFTLKLSKSSCFRMFRSLNLNVTDI